jgi:N-acyl-D-amino-acid deacylase
LDGSGSPAVEGDITIDGGRIASVGGPAGSARLEIDGHGATLAPGFVDTHTHDDGALLAHPDLRFKLAQGCTSLVIGNCGYSAVPAINGQPLTGGLFGRQTATWSDLDGFRRAVDEARPACNSVALVGHNTMRMAAMGDDRRAPTDQELDQMRQWTRSAMEQGACGLSTGLIYVPGRYSRSEEIVELAAELAPFRGLYATHMRNEGDALLDSVGEALAIGRQAGVAVHISHHKAAGRGNWGRVADSLSAVDRANAQGADVTLDVYPYTAGSGRMIEYFDLGRVDLGLARVTRLATCPSFPQYEGRMLVDIASDQPTDLGQLVRAILTSPGASRTICIQYLMCEEDIETNLRHPRVMVGSDGIADLGGRPHPRLFGTFPRVLGEYVRQRKVLSLEEAVRRMTSLACERFGLVGRGRLLEGWWADLVLFDPEDVIDTATYDDPVQEPAGVRAVIVNGQVAYRDGLHTGTGAGRLLRYGIPG